MKTTGLKAVATVWDITSANSGAKRPKKGEYQCHTMPEVPHFGLPRGDRSERFGDKKSFRDFKGNQPFDPID